MNKNIYISGAISSIGQLEAIEQFGAAESYLRSRGYADIINPTKLIIWHIDTIEQRKEGNMLQLSAIIDGKPRIRWEDEEVFWRECMNIGIHELLKCDTIYMLNTWKQSRGSRIELAIAIEMEMQVIHQGILTPFKKKKK